MGKRKRKQEAVGSAPPTDRPTIRLKRSSYQPSKAELEEEVRIDATPEELAKALAREVNIEWED